jgi:hypothetical protein
MVRNFYFCCLLLTAFVFAEETHFNTLRGFAYNSYGTLGASPTIADILQKPNEIYGHKFIYVSPASSQGYSAFDLAGGSALLGFDQDIILGYAKSFYGLSILFSPSKSCKNKGYDGDNDFECSVLGRDYMSANFSVPLGNLIFYANINRIAINNIFDDDASFNSSSNSLGNKGAHVGLTGGNTLFWDLKLRFDHFYGTTTTTSYFNSEEMPHVIVFEDSLDRIGMALLFDIGYKVLQNDNVKFLIGLNNRLFWNSEKEIYSLYYPEEKFSAAFSDSSHLLAIYISPNFFGEIALSKHLFVFVGAEYSFSFDMLLRKDDDYSSNIRLANFSIINYGSGAHAGLRYERKSWAVETRLQSDFFGEIFNKNSPFISLGGFIWL